MPKLRLAVFDLTDCEGCEVELAGLEKVVAKINQDCEVLNFRLLSDARNYEQFDLALVEGMISNPEEVKFIQDLLKWVLDLFQAAEVLKKYF